MRNYASGNPDVCAITVQADVGNRDSFRLAVRSLRFDLNLGFTLRVRWGDPRPLVEFIDRLIGSSLRQWAECDADGRTMAALLTPCWEAEIIRYMERLEYERRPVERFVQAEALYYGGRYPGYRGQESREYMAAKSKAHKLLVSHLNKEQLAEYNASKRFRVKAKDGKVYSISDARSFNVTAPDGTRYCGQLADTPVEDQMLAQKLLLEHEPEKFFNNANSTGGPDRSQLYTSTDFLNARLGRW